MLHLPGVFIVEPDVYPGLVQVSQSVFKMYLEEYKAELIQLLQDTPLGDPKELQLASISIRSRIDLMNEILNVLYDVDRLTTNPTSTNPGSSKGQAA